MKAVERTVYVARDGAEFMTEAQCRAHERKSAGSALVGLSEAQIEAARTGADPELAAAFEAFGYALRKVRQAAKRPSIGEGQGIGEEDGRAEASP